MQQPAPLHEESILLKSNPLGLSHPLPADNNLPWDKDTVAALSYALHQHAARMGEALDLGDVHSIECHLDTGTIIVHQRSECGDFWVKQTSRPQS